MTYRIDRPNMILMGGGRKIVVHGRHEKSRNKGLVKEDVCCAELRKEKESEAGLSSRAAAVEDKGWSVANKGWSLSTATQWQ